MLEITVSPGNIEDLGSIGWGLLTMKAVGCCLGSNRVLSSLRVKFVNCFAGKARKIPRQQDTLSAQ